MADFHALRTDLRAARADLADAEAALAADRERPEQLVQARDAAADAERALRLQFAEHTDPREGVEQLDDTTPFLLMPVRIETRFKDGELWVRVYPDDCWIDGFDPALTDSEVADARAYWLAMAQAGGLVDDERAAWRMLAQAHGSGRAGWIVEQYAPAAGAAAPVRATPEDLILTVAVEAAPDPTEAAAVAAFWTAVWRANGDATDVDAARTMLEGAVGAARAAEVERDLRPSNLDAKRDDRAGVDVQVAFVVLPAAPAAKEQPWARAPRMRVLPDRFVFLAYGGDDEPLVVVGEPVPAELFAGPDPSAPKEEQLHHDADGRLVVPERLRWLSDFPTAVDVGMGFRVPLDRGQRRRGFDRVLVLGVRISADGDAGREELETLLRHHAASRKGLALVPQGTPTNNTEAGGAGHSRLDDPDASFDDRAAAPLFTPAADWLDKRDGQWLAEALGIDPEVLAAVPNAGGRDQRAARAVSTALWPATLGYWMETLMAPAFDRGTIEQTRDFFTRFVVGAGAIPAIRIGTQPYGILPATALSRLRLDAPREAATHGRGSGFLPGLQALLGTIREDWRELLDAPAYVGKEGDPHALLLDIVGLHSGSVEWSRRRAETFATLERRMRMLGFAGFLGVWMQIEARRQARLLLTGLGYDGETDPPILDLIFNGAHKPLRGGLIDERPPSEREQLPAATIDGRTYLKWLADAARTSLDALYAQDGFTGDKPPRALLYLLLRHALQLGYHDTSVRLHEDAGLYTPERAAAARSDDPFLHVADTAKVSESRYQPLFAREQAITGGASQTIAEFIAANHLTLTAARRFTEQLGALDRLEGEPTGRLERALADHLDTCAYRLDAWLLGLVNLRLAQVRGLSDGDDTPPSQGIHLGAFGWLHDLRPEDKELEEVELEGDLEAAFHPGADPPLMRDSTNQGYVHAPSLNHAVAAAVLRNGFGAAATPENRSTLAVNLTSERVRGALALIQGVRAGQGLADLLGYQFERGLHDRHAMAEVDSFVFELRLAFPLRANRIASTKAPEGVPIADVEARNVIDGLALVEHMRTTGKTSYPFGRTDLPAADTTQRAAIDAEADRLREMHDAVADLALSEGVYQAVQGNYDRVASTYDAYARGAFPPEPDVVRTPLPGIGLTHRVALHLPAGASHTSSPVAGIAMTPRAQAEPAVNAWLESVLPPLDEVACVVAFTPAGGGAPTTHEVTLARLGLQPADVVAILHQDPPAMTELDDRVLRAAIEDAAPRPDGGVAIWYLETLTAPTSIFALTPLVRALRRLTTQSRPLAATDLRLANEAQAADDAAPVVETARLEAVRTATAGLRSDIATFLGGLEPLLADLPAQRAAVLARVDTDIAAVAGLLARAASFAIPNAGWGFAYDARRRAFAEVLQLCAAVAARWTARLAEFDAAVAAEAALPAATSDAERIRVLTEAERLVVAVPGAAPATPAAYRTHLANVARPAFAARRDAFAAVAATTRTTLAPLLADVGALLPVSDVDAGAVTLTAQEDAIVTLARDAVTTVKAVDAELERRDKAAQALLTDAAGAAAPRARVDLLGRAARTLLGEDFRIVPEFALASTVGQQVADALTASRTGTPFAHLAGVVDEPVDTWLYGLARVRPKLHDWEQVVMLADAEPALDALQLPHAAGDAWLGLDLKAGQALDRDRLLYAAHFAVAFDPAKRQCGLLLDEWTETIPGTSADTGLVFHHDRPDAEAPQAMLLVTSPVTRGAWRWDDLVDALHETLDLMRLRAVEPDDVDTLPYAAFLPGSVMTTQASQLTIALELALNNGIDIAGVP